MGRPMGRTRGRTMGRTVGRTMGRHSHLQNSVHWGVTYAAYASALAPFAECLALKFDHNACSARRKRHECLMQMSGGPNSATPTHLAQLRQLLQSIHDRHHSQVQPKASLTHRSSRDGSCCVQYCTRLNVVRKAQGKNV